MSVLPSRPGTPNIFSRPAGSSRRAQRNRRRSTVELLEGRVVPSYTFSFNGTDAATVTQSANPGDAGDDLYLVQVPANGLEYSTDGVTFSSVWTGGTPPNSAAVTVTINEVDAAIGNTITIGTSGVSQPDSPISSILAQFVINGTPTSSGVTLDDSTGGSAAAYSYDGMLFNGPNGFSLINNVIQTNGFTVNGSPFADTYNALGSAAGEPVNFVGGVGANIVNVGSEPLLPTTSTLAGINSAVTFTDTQPGGTATVNVFDAGTTNSANGTVSFASPNETVSGLGFGVGGRVTFNAGDPGGTALNLFLGTSAGGTAGVTTNVVSTPAILTTIITGGAQPDVYNVGGAAEQTLSGVAGPLTINGGGTGASTLNLNDQLTSGSDLYTITSTTVTRSGGFGGLTYSGIGFLTLNAEDALAAGAHVIDVNSTAVNTTTTVNANSGANTINVNGTGPGGALVVATGATGGSTVNVVAYSGILNVTTDGVTNGTDTVNIGAASGTGTLATISGPVGLTGNQSYVLNINDEAAATAQTYNVFINNPGNSAALALGAAIPFLSFAPGQLASLTLRGGGQGNIVNFDSTPSLITTTIFAGGGGDATTVLGSGPGSILNIASQAGVNTVLLGGGPSGVQDFFGTSVNVTDTGGTTALTLDDTQDLQVDPSPTITGSSVTALAPATINYTAPSSSGGPGVNQLTINASGDFSTYTINGTLANSLAPVDTTLNTGTNTNFVRVLATTATGPLHINAAGGSQYVTIGDNGSLANILGPITVNNTLGQTALALDASADPASHAMLLQGSATSTSTLTGLTAQPLTYSSAELSGLTIKTGPSGSQILTIDFSNKGNPLPAGQPGLVFNAGADASSGLNTHVLNLTGQLSGGPFQAETHNAESPFDTYLLASPSPGAHFGDIQFVDAGGVNFSVLYTGLQPVNDSAPAVLYTFNDFGYPDQSFRASSATLPGPLAAIEFLSTPTPAAPLNFETTTVANKTNVVFNSPPQTPGLSGPAVNGVVSIPTASAGLTTLTFNTSNAGDNLVSFIALPPSVATAYNGGGAHETTVVTGTGVADGTTLSLDGGPATNTFVYDAGGSVPTVAPIPNGLAITVAGSGTVEAINYQQVSIINVPLVPITPTADPINSVEGFHYVDIPVGSFTAPVPTIFTGLNPGAPPVPTLPAADFTASINWGDPSPDDAAGTITQNAGNPSTYFITGTHTFALASTYTVGSVIRFAGGDITYAYPVTLTTSPVSRTTIPVTVSFSASNGSPISFSDTATITDGPLAVTVFPIVGTEGLPIITDPIATFIDAGGANPASSYTATIAIVNASGLEQLPVAATITQVGSAAQYVVTAPTITLPEEGVYQVLVTITDNSGATPISVTGAGTATVADAPLTAGPAVLLAPITGVLQSNVAVATFTDANPSAPLSDFTATIDWGDGSPTTVGTIVQPGAVGTAFDVAGTHAYAKPGSYTTKVVVTDVGGSVVSLLGTATVTDPPLTGTAANFTAVEGIDTGTILLATINNPNTLAGVSQLTATVNWGDSATNFVVPVSLVGGTPTDSIFQVRGSHTYAEEGVYTVTILVTTTGGASTGPPPPATTTPLTSTATVADAPLVSVGSESISGIEGNSTGTKLIATWTDTNPGATVADFTLGGGSVIVDWGDGTTPDTLPASAVTATGAANGVVFAAAFAHTYAEAGSYQVTTRINDEGGSTSVAHGTAVIADAPLSAPTQTPATTDLNGSTITETFPFTTVVATFNDGNPLAPISDFNYVTIDWGDGSPMTYGTIIQPGGVGTTFAVVGSHTYNNSRVNGGLGAYPTITNVHDEDGSTLVINNAVRVADIPIILTGQLNPASDSGQSNTDAITNANQPNFFGTSEPYSDITLLVAPLGTTNFTVVGQVQADSSGAWSITTSLLQDGKYTVEAHAVEQRPGATTATTQILPNATQGALTIDTVGPKVTALTFNRVNGQVGLTLQDSLTGLSQAQVIDAANYQLTKQHAVRGGSIVNVISATPSGPTGPENVVLTINNGRQIRGGIYTFTVFSGSAVRGIRDVAGNALDGEFYGFFPSGNNLPGGNFVAGLNSVHNVVFAPRTVIGKATPVSPPGTPATGTTIPTANPTLPSGNPNFSGNPSRLKATRARHHARVGHAVQKASVSLHDLALDQLGGGQTAV